MDPLTVPSERILLRFPLSNLRENPSSPFHNSGVKLFKNSDSGPDPSVVNKTERIPSAPSAVL